MSKEKYIKASLRERILLNQFNKIRGDFDILTLTKADSSDKYDAVIMSGGTEYIVEIKVRTYPLSSYTGWVIEKAKYEYLISQYHEIGLIPLYLTFHSDGVQIWDLINSTQPIWIDSLLPANSQSYDNEINKINGDMKQSDAFIYKMPIDIGGAADLAMKHYNKYFK